MACYLWKPVFKWPSNGFSRALPSDTRCRSARLSSQLDKVELFLFSLSLRLKVIFAPSSVCLSYRGNAPRSDVFRDICGRTNWAFFGRRRRRPYDISVTGTLKQSDPAADEEAEKRTIEMLAKLIIWLELWVRGKQPFVCNVSVCAVVTDCSACAHACDVALLEFD